VVAVWLLLLCMLLLLLLLCHWQQLQPRLLYANALPKL
jgi:hypothetical protein